MQTVCGGGANIATGMTDAKNRQTAGSPFLGDVSGAFADLGTFLPLVIGVLTVVRLDAASVMVGFGLFALSTALIYRRPVPVQPMKAVAALAVAGGISSSMVMASGLIIGILLVFLAAVGAIGWLARALPQSVLAGLQLGIGLQLAYVGVTLVGSDWLVGMVMLAALIGLLTTRLKYFSGIIVITIACLWSLSSDSQVLPGVQFALFHPQLGWPDMAAFGQSLQQIVVPQLAMTLTNAVLMTAALASVLFPDDTEQITAKRLSLTSGALNLLLAPLGALPMCHGAGGLAVQHKFGARTGWATAIFGATCLGIGLFFASSVLAILSIIPVAAVGALLIVAGGELALSKRLFDGRLSCLVVILVTGAVCLFINVAVGLILGIIAEFARAAIVRRLFRDGRAGAQVRPTIG